MHEHRRLALFLLLLLAIAAPSGASEETGRVLQVITVKVAERNLPAYLARVRDLNAVQQRLRGSGKLRMWRAIPNGNPSGNVIVSIEYSDLNAFAENYARLQADPEWQEIIAGLPDIRELLSSAVYGEIQP